jgi:Flp pilus assembly protein TadD
MYLAMPGIALAAGSAFAGAFRRRRAYALAAGTFAVLLLATLTLMRNEVWRTHVSLWSDAVAKAPHKARVYVNLGQALSLDGHPEEAISLYCRALALDPGNAQAQNNLYATLDEQTKAALEGGNDVILERLPTGANGEFGLRPQDPCRRALN